MGLPLGRPRCQTSFFGTFPKPKYLARKEKFLSFQLIQVNFGEKFSRLCGVK